MRMFSRIRKNKTLSKILGKRIRAQMIGHIVRDGGFLKGEVGKKRRRRLR